MITHISLLTIKVKGKELKEILNDNFYHEVGIK